MERQMKADREKRAIILTAEGQRESAIRSAEGQKQSQILTAEGAKQAAILSAEGERQSRILRAQGERAAQYLQAQGQAKAIEKVFAAIKSGRPTPELLAYQYLQTLPQMAQGDANKVWIVPSDFGKALEGFTKMLGAPGGDGVFRFEASPVEESTSRPEDDDEAIKDWFDTTPDPEIARVVADAQAEARAEIPPSYVPSTPTPPSPAELPPRVPEELGAGQGRAGLPAGANRRAAAERPSGPNEWSPRASERPGTGEWSSGAGEQSPAPRPRPGAPSAHAAWSDRPRDGSPAAPGGTPAGRESAVPTPPRGIHRVDEDSDTVEHVNPARPGYPTPPRSHD